MCLLVSKCLKILINCAKMTSILSLFFKCNVIDVVVPHVHWTLINAVNIHRFDCDRFSSHCIMLGGYVLYMPRDMLTVSTVTWWRHQMETFSALLALCAGNSPVPGEFPTQRPVTRNVDVYFDLRPNKRLSKQSWGWWFETVSRPLWRHRNDLFWFCFGLV